MKSPSFLPHVILCCPIKDTAEPFVRTGTGTDSQDSIQAGTGSDSCNRQTGDGRHGESGELKSRLTQIETALKTNVLTSDLHATATHD